MESLYYWLYSARDTICSLLSYYHNQGKRMMLWGAGNRGYAFLQCYDPQSKYLMGVYDMYPLKQGIVLATGHHVYAPEAVMCDVIFVLSDEVDQFARRYIKKHARKEKIIDIVDIIFGRLTFQKIISEEKIELTDTREEKIYGLTIMYHPTAQNFSYAKQYAATLDQLIIFDNSPENHRILFNQEKFPENTEYYWNQGENIGLGEPVNHLVEQLKDTSHGWILTFDQDSFPADDMIDDMRRFINSNQCTDDIAIVSPRLVSDERELFAFRNAEFPFFQHTYYIAQSGMLQRIKSIQQIGGYDKNLFIDSVDWDVIVRCMLYGYQTLRLNDCYLYHQMEDKDVKNINIKGHMYHTNKYGPLRYYYQYRNALYCKEKFHGSAYEFIWDEVLKSLNQAFTLEKKSEEISVMLKQAKKDFTNHVMGRYRSTTRHYGGCETDLW